MTFVNDYTLLKTMASQGNVEAKLILELMDKGRALRTQIDGIGDAMGIRSERDHDEILNGVIEDMVGEVLPTILKMTYTGGSVFDSLSFSLSIAQRLDIAIFAYHRWNGKWPTIVTLSNEWKNAMTLSGASTYTYREGSEEHEVTLKFVKLSNREKIECN